MSDTTAIAHHNGRIPGGDTMTDATPDKPKQAGHTPGPWRFELAPSGGFDIEKDPNDLGRYMVIATRGSHPDRAAEMHANARLLAAAPELLDALAALVNLRDYDDYPSDSSKAWRDASDLVQRLRPADQHNTERSDA